MRNRQRIDFILLVCLSVHSMCFSVKLPHWEKKLFIFNIYLQEKVTENKIVVWVNVSLLRWKALLDFILFSINKNAIFRRCNYLYLTFLKRKLLGLGNNFIQCKILICNKSILCKLRKLKFLGMLRSVIYRILF